MAAETFCPLPFCHLQVNGGGTVSPCCVSDYEYLDSDGQPFRMDTSTLSDVWSGGDIAEVRACLASGQRHVACENCWAMERDGRDSHRRKMLRSMADPSTVTNGMDPHDPHATKQPEFVSLRLGNLCNLKCRICGPFSSTKWIQEHNDTRPDGMGPFDTGDSMRWFEGAVPFWEDLGMLLPGIGEMMLTGGEPFLIKRQLDLLRACAEDGQAGSINLQFHTNGTVMPEDLLEKTLPGFGGVRLIFSLDGVGRQFEYQRHGAIWADVDRNVRLCRDSWNQAGGPSGTLAINLTVSAMNAYYLPEYAEYFTDVGIDAGLSFVMGKPDLSVFGLPWVVRHAIAERLRHADALTMSCYRQGTPLGMIIDALESPPSAEQGTQAFNQAMRRMDSYRGENYADAFPEMASLVGYRGP